MNADVRTILQRVLLTLLLVALTFPRLDITTDIGVDNSLAWAFNHLFATGLDQAAHLVFPHGPLAFLMYPQALGGELGAAYFAIVTILGTFIFILLTLGADTDPEQIRMDRRHGPRGRVGAEQRTAAWRKHKLRQAQCAMEHLDRCPR